MLFPPRWNCVRLAGFVEMKRLLNSSFSLILIVKLNIAFCDEQQNFITLNWKWNKSWRTQNVLSISNSSYLLHREVKYSVIIKGKKSLKLVSVWSRLCKNIKKYSKIDKKKPEILFEHVFWQLSRLQQTDAILKSKHTYYYCDSWCGCKHSYSFLLHSHVRANDKDVRAVEYINNCIHHFCLVSVRSLRNFIHQTDSASATCEQT